MSEGLRVPASAATANEQARRGAVLVVDADSAVRRVLCLVLEGAGYLCEACSDIHEAAERIPALRPQLVLAEVGSGSRSGQELAARVAHAGGWRPLFALMSPYPRPRQGFEDYFLSKPIQFDHLLGILDAVSRGSAH